MDVTPAELPNELPPMRDPKRYRFSPPCSQLSNLPYYNMNLRQHAKLNLEIEGAAEEGLYKIVLVYVLPLLFLCTDPAIIEVSDTDLQCRHIPPLARI